MLSEKSDYKCIKEEKINQNKQKKLLTIYRTELKIAELFRFTLRINLVTYCFGQNFFSVSRVLWANRL